MVFDFRLDQSIFLHSIESPPHKDLICSITLNQINSTDQLQLIKFGCGYQTEYILQSDNPLKIGFNDSKNDEIKNGLANLVLAMNLLLTRTCVLLLRLEFGYNDIKFKSMPSKALKVAKDAGNNHTTKPHDAILLRDYVTAVFAMKEDLDEKATIATFRKLQNTNRFNVSASSTITDRNLAKALKEFENAMNSTHGLTILEHLYNTIELTINYDGSKAKGGSLDKKVNQLLGISEIDARLWRELYNGSKCSDFKTKDIATFLRGPKELPQVPVKARSCAASLLLARL